MPSLLGLLVTFVLICLLFHVVMLHYKVYSVFCFIFTAYQNYHCLLPSVKTDEHSWESCPNRINCLTCKDMSSPAEKERCEATHSFFYQLLLFFSPKCLFLLTGTKYLHIRYICWNTNWGYVIAELFMSHYVEVFSTLWNINYPFAHWRCVLVCFQSKEERLLELETENAILHLRLAEVRWFLTFIT